MAAVVAAALLAVAAPGAGATSPAATVLSGVVPSWATSPLGPVPAAAGVEVPVGLPWRRSPAELVRAVSDPAACAYGFYLSRSQFRDRFAPDHADEDVDAGWHRQAGLEVCQVPAN